MMVLALVMVLVQVMVLVLVMVLVQVMVLVLVMVLVQVMVLVLVMMWVPSDILPQSSSQTRRLKRKLESRVSDCRFDS